MSGAAARFIGLNAPHYNWDILWVMGAMGVAAWVLFRFYKSLGES